MASLAAQLPRLLLFSPSDGLCGRGKGIEGQHPCRSPFQWRPQPWVCPSFRSRAKSLYPPLFGEMATKPPADLGKFLIQPGPAR